MPVVKHAVIAAAGLGSRLGHGLPKCMIEIDEKTILERLIENLSGYVSDIHIVVGYREELIINHCSKHHRNIVIVRNPDYRSTNTAYSMSLGARGLKGKTIFMDGDLIIEPNSLHNFIDQAIANPITAAITKSKSDNAVNVELEEADVGLKIIKFTREKGFSYEWANIFTGPPSILDGNNKYVYNTLENHHPLNACKINLCEIDTVPDLERAKIFIKSISSPSGL